MGKKTSEAQKKRYASYYANSVATKNKERKLARHLKKHPNDEQSAKRVTPPNAGKYQVQNNRLVKRVNNLCKTGAFKRSLS